jgi:hypothetical protein
VRRFGLPDWRLVLILLLSGLIAFAFARATPQGANPDEGPHREYIKRLVTERRLPALDLEQRRRLGHADPNYEAHQPPLYYVLAAPFYAAGNTAGGEYGGEQAARFFTVLIGLAGVAMVWLLARELAPDRPGLWVAATSVAAFLPGRLAVTAAVSNDALTEAAGTLTLLLIVRALKGPWARKQWIWLGAALGLSLLCKQSAVLLLPIAFLAILFAAKLAVLRELPDAEPAEQERETTGLLLRSGGVITAALVVCAGWWFVRNLVLYGDPLAQKLFNLYFADTYRWEGFRAAGFTFQEYLSKRVLPTAFLSFWGWFGNLTPEHSDLALGAYGFGPPRQWGYPPRSWLMPILWCVVLFAGAGAGVYALRRKLSRGTTEPGAERNPGVPFGVGMIALHAVFVLGAFLNFNATYFQAQGRYLFPAIGAIALGLAAGCLEWVRGAAFASAPGDPRKGSARARTWEAAAGWGIGAAMLALAAYAYFGVLVPGFSHS